MTFNNSLIKDNVLPPAFEKAARKLPVMHKHLIFAKKLKKSTWAAVYETVKSDPLELLQLITYRSIPKSMIDKVLKEVKDPAALGIILATGSNISLKKQKEVFKQNKKDADFLMMVLDRNSKIDQKLKAKAFKLSNMDLLPALHDACLTKESLSESRYLSLSDEKYFELASEIVKDYASYERPHIWEEAINSKRSILKYLNSSGKIESNFILGAFHSKYANDLDLDAMFKIMAWRGLADYTLFLKAISGNVFLNPENALRVLNIFESKKSDSITTTFNVVKANLEDRVKNNIFADPSKEVNDLTLEAFINQDTSYHYKNIEWFIETFKIPTKSNFTVTPRVLRNLFHRNPEVAKLLEKTFNQKNAVLSKKLKKKIGSAKITSLYMFDDSVNDDDYDYEKEDLTLANLLGQEGSHILLSYVMQSLKNETMLTWETLFVLSETFEGTVDELLELVKTV